jgi:hypothetical protein
MKRPIGLLLAAAALALPAAALAGASPFIGTFTTATPLTSTVPGDGDQNPYGIVTVPRSVGRLVAGDLLVSNFNNDGSGGGLQGTGTTIDEINPAGPDFAPGDAPLFATIDASHLPGRGCPGGIGLTTALSALPTGYVIVGSLPTTDGQADTAAAGCLLVLNSAGRVVETIAGGAIDGPWDMTSVTQGFVTTLFVSNVLPGISSTAAANATVVRIRLLTLPGIAPIPFSEDVIGTGFDARTDPTALVIGPTGVALSSYGTLYVADTLNSRIAEIPDALFRDRPQTGGGITVSQDGDLNGPLGLTLAPNGDILSANSLDGNIVETTPGGLQVAEQVADSATGAGALFGLTVSPGTNGVYYVDDGSNTLNLLH